MTLSEARRLARSTADDTNSTAYVYEDVQHSKTSSDSSYDVAFSIPKFGLQIGEPFTPMVRKKKVKTTTEPVLETMASSMGRSSGTSDQLRSHQTEPTD